VETKTPTSWMPLREAKTYQKWISKWTIPWMHPCWMKVLIYFQPKKKKQKKKLLN